MPSPIPLSPPSLLLFALVFAKLSTPICAVTGPGFPCADRLPACRRKGAWYECETPAYKTGPCDVCVDTGDPLLGPECTATCYEDIGLQTAPAIIAGRTAFLLSSMLEKLSDAALLQYGPALASATSPASSPLKSVKERVVDVQRELRQSKRRPDVCLMDKSCSPRRVITSPSLTFDDVAARRSCPKGGANGAPSQLTLNLTSTREGTANDEMGGVAVRAGGNPHWCSMNLRGLNRVPVSTGIYLQGSSSLWKEAVLTAMNFITQSYKNSWQQVFITKYSGSKKRPKFKLKKKDGNRYLVIMFFKAQYIQEVQNLCS